MVFSFQLINGVALLGGFAGVGSKDPDQRDVEAHQTTLSGMLSPGRSYHVVTGNGTDSSAVLDGFTVSFGLADEGGSTNFGGGLLNWPGSPTLIGCTFLNNFAIAGGAIYNNSESNPAIVNCSFVGNNAKAVGGAIENSGADPIIIGCTFRDNASDVGGGAIDNTASDPILANCLFTLNFGSAGAIFNLVSSPTIVNCTFGINFSSAGGGAMRSVGASNPQVANSIVWFNGPDGLVDVNGAQTSVLHSDIQGGWPGAGNFDTDPLFASLDKSDFRLLPGSPCIDAANNGALPADLYDLDGDGDTTEPLPFDLDGNPRFVDDPDTPDCQQAPGLCGQPPDVDVGAYEFQPPTCFDVITEEVVCHSDGTTFTYTAEGIEGCTSTMLEVSFTASGGAVGEEMCATVVVEDSSGGFCCTTELCVTVPDCSKPAQNCDLDADGVVGATDLLALLAAWGTNPGGAPDFDGDGNVGITDLLILLGNWGPSP